MFGACGSCGAACCAGCCCASTPVVMQSDARASAATTVVLGVFMAVLPVEISKCRRSSVNGSDLLDCSEARIGLDAIYCKLVPRRQDVDEITWPHSARLSLRSGIVT